MTLAPDRPADADPATAASISLAWLIVFNKPFYPLYVWWLTGHGWTAVWTVASMPLFAALPWLARRNSLWVRAGVPALGIADTIAANIIFGESAGASLFLVPCALLLLASLRGGERWLSLSLGVAAFLIAVGLRGRYPGPLYQWSEAQTASLLSLNIYSVAALSLFILWRFADRRSV